MAKKTAKNEMDKFMDDALEDTDDIIAEDFVFFDKTYKAIFTSVDDERRMAEGYDDIVTASGVARIKQFEGGARTYVMSYSTSVKSAKPADPTQQNVFLWNNRRWRIHQLRRKSSSYIQFGFYETR